MAYNIKPCLLETELVPQETGVWIWGETYTFFIGIAHNNYIVFHSSIQDTEELYLT